MSRPASTTLLAYPPIERLGVVCDRRTAALLHGSAAWTH
jgi:hypothetical protein